MDRNVSEGEGPEDATAERISADDVTLGALGGNIAFHLRLAQDASFKAFKRHTGEADLRPGWYAVLSLIDDNPGITPMALSRASGRDKSTLTPVLRDLIAHGLVRQRPIPNDRRSYAMHLTSEGKERLARLTKHAEAHDQRIDDIVGPKKRELIELLRRITDLLD
jgi:DNA-binding MarR family transcriptional regulator